MRKIYNEKFVRYLGFGILISIPVLVIIFFSVFRAHQIKKIIVISSIYPLRNIEEIGKGNTLVFNSSSVSERIIQDNPFVKRVALQLRLPDTLVATIDVGDPKAVVVANGEFYLIDENGYMLRKTEEIGAYPTIEGTSLLLFQYSQADWRVVKALKFIIAFADMSIFIDRISIDNTLHEYKLLAKNGVICIVSYESQPLGVATSLQTIIRRFRIDGKTVSSVDFRFDKPIVLLSNGEKISSSFK